MDKVCNSCGQTKDIYEFYKNSKTADKLFPECKDCNIKRVRKWQTENWSKKLENDRKFWHTHRVMLIAENKIRRDNREYGGNRRLVFQRDNYRCVVCGISEKDHIKQWGVELHCDHIDRNRLNNNMTNLRTICIKCHGSLHGKQSPTKFNTGKII